MNDYRPDQQFLGLAFKIEDLSLKIMACKMNIFLSALLLILLSFLIHLIIWKIRLPKYQTKTLILIFFGTFFISIFLFELFIPANYQSSQYVPQNFFDYVHIFLFFTSIMFAYLITYSAIEVDSPSLVITELIFDAGPGGLSKDALFTRLSDEVLVIPRINDLLRDNMIVSKGGKLNLTRKGKWFVMIFIFYRFLLNAKRGG